MSNLELWGAGHGLNIAAARNIQIESVWCDSTYDDCVFLDDPVDTATVSNVVSHFSRDNGVDVQADNVVVSHVTVVRPRNRGITLYEPSENVEIRDAIVYDVRDMGHLTLVDPLATNPSYDYNLWWDPEPADRRYVSDATLDFAGWMNAGFDAHGIESDPLFVNPGGRAWPMGSTDFALCVDSPGRFAASDGGHIGGVQVLDACGVVSVPGSSLPGSSPPRLSVSPNPFAFRTHVSLDVASPGRLRIVAIDVSGRLVGDVFDGHAASGQLELAWDGRGPTGSLLPIGVYFLKALGAVSSEPARVVLLR